MKKLLFLLTFASVFMAGCVCGLFDDNTNSTNTTTTNNTIVPVNDTPVEQCQTDEECIENGLGNVCGAGYCMYVDEPADNLTDLDDDEQDMSVPMNETEILTWLSSDEVWADDELPVNDTTKRNFECVDDTILRYEELVDATYGVWDIDYDTCTSNGKGNVFFLNMGLKESEIPNGNWEYVSHDESRGIYQFTNNATNVELMYLISNFPENYLGKYDEKTKFKRYFADSICRLPDCSSGALDAGDVKMLQVNGYDAYLMHNDDWTGIEMAFFAVPCQLGNCHNYGTTYVYVSLRGEKEQVLQTLYDINHGLLIKS